MQSGSVARLLPIFGGEILAPFKRVEDVLPKWPRAGVLYAASDNTSARQLHSACQAQAFLLFQGHYHNLVSLHSSLSRGLDRLVLAQVERHRSSMTQPKDEQQQVAAALQAAFIAASLLFSYPVGILLLLLLLPPPFSSWVSDCGVSSTSCIGVSCGNCRGSGTGLWWPSTARGGGRRVSRVALCRPSSRLWLGRSGQPSTRQRAVQANTRACAHWDMLSAADSAAARTDKLLGQDSFDGVLLGIGTYMKLKGAAQYEIKGVRIAQLQNRTITIRYNVFPPTRCEPRRVWLAEGWLPQTYQPIAPGWILRKDYLSLFTSALEAGSPHCLEAAEMKHCLDVGTGTGVLSFLLSTSSAQRSCEFNLLNIYATPSDAYGASRVLGVDVNEDALINARQNRALLGIDPDQVDFARGDVFPDQPTTKFDLVVCNPPWIPISEEPCSATPRPTNKKASNEDFIGGVIDRSGLLPSLFCGLKDWLSSKGRLWLIYSDLPVKLGLQDAVPLPCPLFCPVIH